MEKQLHHTHGPHYGDPLHPTGAGKVDEHGGVKKSAFKNVKEEVHKLKNTLKHGHGGHGEEDDDAEAVNKSPAVRSGLVEPTEMGKPVLAEDLHATHSDIVDPPVRPFAQWEKEERVGAPPPLSTGVYGTDRSEFSHHGPNAPKPTTAFSPATHHTDPTDAGGKKAGNTQGLESLDKMGVPYYEPYSRTTKSDENEPRVYTGSHNQFAPEPVENPALNTRVAGESKEYPVGKVVSEVITNDFRRPQQTSTYTSVRDEGEGRLQDSGN